MTILIHIPRSHHLKIAVKTSQSIKPKVNFAKETSRWLSGQGHGLLIDSDWATEESQSTSSSSGGGTARDYLDEPRTPARDGKSANDDFF
ncbi:hypothetical protein TNCT_148831 [Trichonephila clavata]|uniref:Uncharacterized protein n=1 Tax=Trichonephila clavata TaxID=2740835 RepID=A0A8X6JQX6_TRICU|nr:hypothetical protein TNCT_148831 [Trichonephila clavata]